MFPKISTWNFFDVFLSTLSRISSIINQGLSQDIISQSTSDFSNKLSAIPQGIFKNAFLAYCQKNLNSKNCFKNSSKEFTVKFDEISPSIHLRWHLWEFFCILLKNVLIILRYHFKFLLFFFLFLD